MKQDLGQNSSAWARFLVVGGKWLVGKPALSISWTVGSKKRYNLRILLFILFRRHHKGIPDFLYLYVLILINFKLFWFILCSFFFIGNTFWTFSFLWIVLHTKIFQNWANICKNKFCKEGNWMKSWISSIFCLKSWYCPKTQHFSSIINGRGET